MVGIVKDIRQREWFGPADPEIFVPYAQSPFRTNDASHYAAMTLVVRSAGEPSLLIEPIRDIITSLNGSAPVTNVATLEQVVNGATWQPRFNVALTGVFGALGLLLATMGLYGVVAYGVAQRTREFGVRLALGATVTSLQGLVLWHGLRLIAYGVAAGVVGAFVLAKGTAKPGQRRRGRRREDTPRCGTGVDRRGGPGRLSPARATRGAGRSHDVIAQRVTAEDLTMSRLTGWLTRWRRALRRRAFEVQMTEEMRGHLEQETARHVAAGEDADAAHRHAALEFGHADSFKEQVRDHRLGHWLEELWRNVRFALRNLRKTPGFTAIAVATIAIGIGAGTAVFSLVNAILLRSLPVPNPQELRVLHWSGTEVRMRSYNGNDFGTVGDRTVQDAVNHPTFLHLREQAAPLADLFGFFPANNITMITPRAAVATDGLMVSDNFFSALRVHAFIGHLFEGGDDAAGQSHVVLSHAFWQRRFGGDPDALGEVVTMLGREFTVTGILPREFPGIHPGTTHDFYVSMSAGSPFLYVPFEQDWHWFIRMMARLQPDVADAQLAAALSPVFARADPERVKDGRIELVPGWGGLGFDRDRYGRPLEMMLGVTALVMLIACANLAGLSLSRGAAREHELAVRAALGAGRRRLVGQSLAESILLAAAGGGLGVVLAVWGREVLSHLLDGSTAGLRYDLSLNRGVLAFSVIAAASTAVLAGLLPALRAGRVDPLDGLKSRGTLGAPRLRVGRFLVVAQICVSLSVLAGAGLGLRSLLNLRRIDPGFHTDNLLVFSLNPSSAGYDTKGVVDFHDRVQAALAALPGVTNATVMHYAHLSDRSSSGGFRFADDDLPPDEFHWTKRQAASASFFDTMGIPIIEGRGLRMSDSIDAPKVVVVNETFAREVSPDRDPIGRTFNMWSADWTIIGVCRDAKVSNLKDDISPTTYFAFPQRFYDRFNLGQVYYAVRASLPAEALRRAIERAVASINPNVPVTDFSTQNALLDRNIGQERMLAMLCSALAVVVLLLCCIGLYGLIAYDVTRRRSEIAIRMAIGAQPGDIARPVVRGAVVLTLIGVGAGLPIAVVVSRLIQNQLYDVSPYDPLTAGVVVAFLIGVGAVAALVPAWRATKFDPLEALRSE